MARAELRYPKMKKRIPVRNERAEKAGLGFDLGPNGPTVGAAEPLENAA